MKKILFTIVFVIVAFNFYILHAIAQSPEKFSYQAVIRNISNQLVTNQVIGMQISILQGSTSGTAVYVETHTPTTNANGLVTIEIGGGTVVNGNITNINWSNGPYFIKTETDLTGGTNYTITGTSQLLSVPYAFYAKTAGVAQSGGQTVIQNDSLVLKDAQGVTRMILNPNTGTFKMMNKDTVWYEMSVKSPKMEYLQLDGGKYIVSKKENGAEIMELYQNGNLIGRVTETQDYDGSYYSNTKTSVTEEFGFNPDTKTYQKVRETTNEDVDYLHNDDHSSLTNIKLYHNNQVSEETSVVTKYNKVIDVIEHTETTYHKVYDDQGNVMKETKVVKDFVNNTTKTYIKAFGDYYLVEEKNDPLVFEQTKSVGDNSGNVTSTKLGKDKFAVSNSNPNAKGLEYTYDNTTNSTQLNYVNSDGTKTNIARMDKLGNVDYGPNNAIKTNSIGETFTNNTYVAGDLLCTKNAEVYGNLNVQGTKNFRINHPTDNSKLIQHASIESNQVYNQYSGNVTTNSEGFSIVTMPSYFKYINYTEDMHYQLTVMSTDFVNAIIYSKYDENTNSFTIKTSSPNTEVSWQVTTIRNDSYMQSNPFIDVLDKK